MYATIWDQIPGAPVGVWIMIRRYGAEEGVGVRHIDSKKSDQTNEYMICTI